jgi:hypothetical protein
VLIHTSTELSGGEEYTCGPGTQIITDDQCFFSYEEFPEFPEFPVGVIKKNMYWSRKPTNKRQKPQINRSNFCPGGIQNLYFFLYCSSGKKAQKPGNPRNYNP